MLERDLTKQIVKMLRGYGYLVCKLTMLGRYGMRGWPDLMVLPGGGRVLFLEVKVLGGKLTVHQARLHDRLSEDGYSVHVVRSLEDVGELL